MPRLLAATVAAPIGHELAALAEALARVTVRLRAGVGGEGCGVVWREGLVISNAHVVRGPRTEARLRSGETLALRLLARDTDLDLALLAAPTRLTPAPLGDAETLRAGELVVALGHPLGVPNAAALGVVHRLVRDERGALRWISADLQLAPGNSGGPLAGVDGKVLGINTLMSGGRGFAVPAPVVERFLREAA
ncbi:MAG TPA: trypsin-like peptidase domain-containing protein [Gemmatimonadales bacterium]|nr:trypsin-like peptidase domain-containing protein [Gemmatimonadales bacterium]